MEILKLHPDQITRKILNVLNALADTTMLTISEAKRIVNSQIHNNIITYVGYVNGEPVAIGTIVYWEKLIHNGSNVAVLEDISVKKNCQGKGYGEQLVRFLTKKAFEAGVYKVILTCDESLEEFYSKNDFHYAGFYMRKNA